MSVCVVNIHKEADIEATLGMFPPWKDLEASADYYPAWGDPNCAPTTEVQSVHSFRCQDRRDQYEWQRRSCHYRVDLEQWGGRGSISVPETLDHDAQIEDIRVANEWNRMEKHLGLQAHNPLIRPYFMLQMLATPVPSSRSCKRHTPSSVRHSVLLSAFPKARISTMRPAQTAGSPPSLHHHFRVHLLT